MGFCRGRRRLRSGLGSIVLLILVVAAIAAVYIERQAGERSARYIERAELFALAFADRAALYLSEGKIEELRLLAQTVALGNTLYIQVYAEGRLILDERGPLAEGLELAPIPSEPSPTTASLERRSSSGRLHYLEIVRPLPRLGSIATEGHVRLGTSLEPLERELGSEALFIAGLSLALILLGAALILYFTRPLVRRAASPAEVEVKASARASASPPALVLDDAAKRVLLRGREVELSPREYELLRLLASAPGRVFSDREILEAVWKGQGFATAKDVKQYIYLLRRKLEQDPRNPELILTVRGFGYKLNRI